LVSRVLSTDEAKQAINRMQTIINGNLSQEINSLAREGQILSDPNNWDGMLAQQFRDGVWPQTKAALDRAVAELEELRQQISKINTDIMMAGGSA
jgi:uncharacterized protein YukE